MTHLETLSALTNHQDSHVPHPKELLEQRGEGEPHLQSLELYFITQFSFLLCVSPQLWHLHLSVVSVSTALYSCTVYCTIHWDTSFSPWLRQVSPGPSYCTHHTCEASSRDHLQGTDTAMLSTCLLCLIYFRTRTQVYVFCMIKEFTFITSSKQMQWIWEFNKWIYHKDLKVFYIFERM